MDDKYSGMIEVPVTEVGVNDLLKKVYPEVVGKITELHPGIPGNQLRTIVAMVVEETFTQLIATTKIANKE